MSDSPSTRADETTRAILERAARRARAVSERCLRASTVRAPEPAPSDTVDLAKVARIRPAPRRVERDDAYEERLAVLLGMPRGSF